MGTTRRVRGERQLSDVSATKSRLSKIRSLGAVEFGDRIILFGAALLLSVLPLIILLSALASQRVDDDIARHLVLGREGTRIVEGLFRRASVSFNLGIFVSLLLSFAGTIAVARSARVTYERTFDQLHRTGNTEPAPLLRVGRGPGWVLGS